MKKRKGAKKLLVAITGNLCTGKTTVLGLLEGMGYAVFSFDKAADRVLKTDQDVVERVAEAFPEAMEDKKINKKMLGDIVFSDKTSLGRLEDILLPRLFQIQEEFIRDIEDGIAFFEVPLLFERNMRRLYDKIILLTVPSEVQMDRLKKRKIPREKGKKILEVQAKPEIVKKQCDYLIDSNQKLESIKKELGKIINGLKSGF